VWPLVVVNPDKVVEALLLLQEVERSVTPTLASNLKYLMDGQPAALCVTVTRAIRSVMRSTARG